MCCLVYLKTCSDPFSHYCNENGMYIPINPNPYKLQTLSVSISVHSISYCINCLFFTFSLFPAPPPLLCVWMCLSLRLFVMQRLEQCDFTLTPVCAPLSIPRGVGHCKCLQWLLPTPSFAHRLYWVGYWAGVALIPKGTSLPPPPSPICFLSQSSFFPSPALIGPEKWMKPGLFSGPTESRTPPPPPFLRLRASGVQIAQNRICPLFAVNQREVMAKENSCCRVCSRGLYSCHWRSSSRSKRAVSILIHSYLNMWIYVYISKWPLVCWDVLIFSLASAVVCDVH